MRFCFPETKSTRKHSFESEHYLTQWEKSPKKQSEGVHFCKYTPTDCFFGDFAYWEAIYLIEKDLQIQN